ncbi:MAG: T9SS type A sorting domain-containing protein [Ignavibacteria bacterium]|nr:T9SS type A sorting domain-containing protein [Ignavibacteria bacterium]
MEHFFKAIIVFLSLVSINTYAQSGWSVQNSGTFENLNDIKFIDINTGWAVGNAGVVLKTTNGGTNWSLVNTGFGNNNYCIQIYSANTFYIGSTSSRYLKTTNAGVNWVSLITDPNTSGYIGSLYFLTDQAGYVSWNTASTNDYLYNTTNAGSNWNFTGQLVGAGKLYFYNGTNNGWMVGIATPFNFNQQNYGYTTDGVNWTYKVIGDAGKLNGVNFITSTLGYTVGNNGKIYKSTNSGLNWVTQTSSVNSTLKGIASKDPSVTWAIGDNGVILNTTNGGSNWTSQLSPTTQTLNSIYVPVNSNTGWIAGNQGIILKTVNGGVGVKQISSSIPSEYKLFQNYPNPFNPTTNIKFQIPRSSFVKLELYDINGKHISTLVSEQLNSGTYEFTIDANHLYSGTYFLILNSNNFFVSQKIVLVK